MLLVFAALLSVHSVQSIDIVWRWGTGERAQHAQSHIHRFALGFVEAGGWRIPNKRVRDFVDAVNQPGTLPIQVAQVGIDGDYLKSQIPVWEPICLGADKDNTQLANLFEGYFTDVPTMEQNLSTGLSVPASISGNRPQLSVTVRTSDETVTLKSSSTNLHMMPVEVQTGRERPQPNYNLSLMPAIGGLLPIPERSWMWFGGHDRERLTGSWAGKACDYAKKS